MIEIDYRRWGIFKSKRAFFCDHIPSTNGYHFVICTDCYSEIDVQHVDKLKEQTTLTIDLTQDSDNLFAQVHKNRRKMIRRGLKIGYEINPLTPNVSLLKEFRYLFNRSIVKKGATPIITLTYFKALIPYMTIIKIKYKNKTLGMMLVVHDGNTAKGHHLAYNEDATVDQKIRDYMGVVLYWKVLMYFKEMGYQTFDFGAIELGRASSMQGVTSYKVSFGGKIITTFWYEIAVTREARISMQVMQFMEIFIRKILHKFKR